MGGSEYHATSSSSDGIVPATEPESDKALYAAILELVRSGRSVRYTMSRMVGLRWPSLRCA